MYKKIFSEAHRKLTCISLSIRSKSLSCTATNLVRPLVDFHSREALANRVAPILQACCDQSLPRQVKQVHAQLLVSYGFSENSILGTKIMACYVLCGSFFHAKHVFHALDLRFASPWNWMIRWFGSNSLFDAAMRFYFKMLGHGVLPDKYTFPSLIKACGGLKNLKLAKMVHRNAEMMGLEVDVFVGSSLINLYTEHGMVQSARELFDKMVYRDIVLWNAMLRGYARNRDPKGSFEMFMGLCESDEVKPNSVSFACMLSVCAFEELLGFGSQLHSWTVKCGLELDSPVANTLLAMYSKCQRLNDARKLFNLTPKIDLVTWNGMISGFVQNGLMNEASCCFRDMISSRVKPDPVTFASFLPCITESADLRRGKEIHGYVIRNSVNFDAFLKTALIDLYFKCRRVEMARKILDRKSATADVVVCTALISGFVLNGMSADALEIFRWLLKHKLRPNSVTLASVFPAFAALAALRLGKELHAFILKCGPHGECFVESAIADMYAKSGRLDLARRVFLQMRKRDAVAWNTMITSCSQNGEPGEALEFFRQMGSEQKYDCVSISAALSSCANLPLFRHGREIHGLMIRTGIGSNDDIFSGSSLVDTYAKCGRLDLSRRVFDSLQMKNEVSWNSIIAAHGTHGRLEECLELFHEMLDNGFFPDHVTFVAIISACGHSGRVDDGVRYFNSMITDYKIRPRMEHYACLVDLYGRAGRLREAFEAIKNMPFPPDAGVWGTLLGACRVHRNAELAGEAARRLFELDPRNSGYYVLMSNVHAEAGDWESVLRVRGLMRERGVQKIPGYSWIDINSATRVFVAADRTHPETTEIYLALNSLIAEMRKEGYVPHPSIPNSTMGGLPSTENTSSTVSLLESKDKKQGSVVNNPSSATKPKKKICCACPDTKKLRDECIVEHGEDACEKWIEAHRKCLRAEGFKV